MTSLKNKIPDCSLGGLSLIRRVWFTAVVLVLLVPSLGVVLPHAHAASSWTTVSPMPISRTELAAASDGSHIYVTGGACCQIPATALSELDIYTAANDSWWTGAPMPTPRWDLVLAYANGKVYAIGGQNDPSGWNDLSTNEEYDPLTNTWTTKAPMPITRHGMAAAVVGGKIYVLGGYSPPIDSQTALGNVEVYDPSNDSWSELAPMPTPRREFAAVAVNDTIYAIGGQSHLSNWVPLATVEAYNTTSNTWSTLPDMPTARPGLAAAEVNGQIYVVGGEIPSGDCNQGGSCVELNNTESYNPSNSTWSILEGMPTARAFLAAASVAGQIFAIGGDYRINGTPVFLSTVEAYSPGVDAPMKTGELSQGNQLAASNQFEQKWVHQFGTSKDDFALGTAAYQSSVYVVGSTYGVLPGQTGNGGADAFIVKFGSDGSVIWTRQFGTSGQDGATSIAVDSNGVFVVGYTSGVFPGQTKSGSLDAFLAKFDFNGNLIWIVQFGSAGANVANSVAIDDATGVYVAGVTRGSGYNNGFIMKFGFDGTLIWDQSTGWADNTSVVTLSTSPGQGVFAAWTYNGEVNLSKYGFDGTKIWTVTQTSGKFDVANAIATSQQAGIFVAGSTFGTWPGQRNQGGYDAFVQNYDFNGNLIWTRQFGSPLTDSATGVAVNGSSVDVVGYTFGSIQNQMNHGGMDSFLAQYDLSGNLLGMNEFGTASEDKASSIAIDSGVVCVAGSTYGTFVGQSRFGGFDAFISAFSSMTQVTMTVSYSVPGGGSPTAPVFKYVLKGAPNSLTLTKTATKVSVDAGATWTLTPNPLGGSSSTQRWDSNQALSGSASSETLVFMFYRQTLQKLSYSVTGGGSGYSSPTFKAKQFGSSTPVTLTTSVTGYWLDYGSSWTIANPLPGSSSSERWYTTQPTSGIIGASTTTTFSYQNQYYLTLKAIGPGSVTPGSGWNNAGSIVSIKATPNSGHKFKSWTGSGTGSYTGKKNPATVTMNSAITEIANFT